MKKRIALLLVVLMVTSLLLSACSSKNSTASTSGTGTQGQNQASNAASNAALSPAAKLAVGTLKLEGTAQAVTAEQASTLLTLWQAYQALSNSDTTAQVELDAVVKQIQEAMTADQIKAMDAMSITRQTMNELMQSMGLGNGPNAQSTPVAGQSTSGNSPFSGSSGANGAGGPPSSGPGGGGFTVSGGGPGDMGGMPPDAAMGAGGTGGTGTQATPDATAQARISAQATRVNPMLLQALITMLKSKSQ